MKRAYLLLGSNEGDRLGNLEKACAAIESMVAKSFVSSSVYQTAAWGKEDQPSFLNQVIGVETELNPHDLLKAILQIEVTLGRVRSEKWGSRTIDIDILFYGDEIINTTDLIIPHSRIAERRFTLIPMMEVAPELLHPVVNKSMRQLLEECEDGLEVEIFKR